MRHGTPLRGARRSRRTLPFLPALPALPALLAVTLTASALTAVGTTPAAATDPPVVGVSASLESSVNVSTNLGPQCSGPGGTATDTRDGWSTSVGNMTTAQSGSYTRNPPIGDGPDTGEATASGEMTASVDTTNGLLVRFDSTRTASASASSVRGYEFPSDPEVHSACAITARAGSGSTVVEFDVAQESAADLEVAGGTGQGADVQMVLQTVPAEGFPVLVTSVASFDVTSRSVAIGPGRYRLTTSYSSLDVSAGFNHGSGDNRTASHEAHLFLTPIGNHAPVAVDDDADTDEDVAVVVDVLGNDTDEDGDELSVESHTDSTHGTVTCGATCTYSPDPGFSGNDEFAYVVTDGTDTDTGLVRVHVEPAPNAAPNTVPKAIQAG